MTRQRETDRVYCSSASEENATSPLAALSLAAPLYRTVLAGVLVDFSSKPKKEQERARESKREQEGARGSKREQEGARGSKREQEEDSERRLASATSALAPTLQQEEALAVELQTTSRS